MTIQPSVSPAVFDPTPVKHYTGRWRLNRGGIMNVWFYYDDEFAFSGGRVVWRGTNGAGKSRAMEMLLPFLLDADRRHIDATGAGKVRLEDLMHAGLDPSAANRIGYLWLELSGQDDDGEPAHLTIGALLRHSRSTKQTKTWYFTTSLRVGTDLQLVDRSRTPLSRERLAEIIGAERLLDRPDDHRERIRTEVFGLAGESGRERFFGLLQLLRVLRNPRRGQPD